jgi:alpha-amylase/alpha-mannosidase (GH57 family)
VNRPVCLCLHGHFYQPPRENAWLEYVERQESASPYHDWNERIHYECYSPNSRARVYDRHGQVVGIVNNFEKISFNVGPTLMSWLETHHPETYRRIIDADRLSRMAHKGHGNAMAQVYNHMIMPLATRRDKATQVRWGIEEFRLRFGRDPEGMWLPETACNEETLEILVEEGIRFTLLEPQQAEAFRPLGGEWRDCSGGQIDPKQPYRCYLRNRPDKFIDIFFYDGPISKAVSFEDLLKDARHLLGKLESAMVHEGERPQLIHFATDGETYGHHKPFGDRVIAYLLNTSAPERGYRIVNYGEFLEEYPPEAEVRLKAGENHEGTSWSCPHGVRRWKDHCGCRGGGPGEWNQHWRKPLREALDWLRDRLSEVYEEQAPRYLKDIWEVRDNYIHVLLNRERSRIENFFFRFGQQPLTGAEMTTCLKLLEMQRYAMLMYTSCGWFFTEVSGIETQQILQYAARAIQLASELGGTSLEEEFLTRLSKARSNIEWFKDGRGVYEKLVKPAIATIENVVGAFAIGSIFEDYYPAAEDFAIYSYDVHVHSQRREASGNLTLNFGRVRVTSRVTLEERDMIFSVVQIGLYDFHCSIKPYVSDAELEKLEQELFNELDRGEILELVKKVDAYPGVSHLTLKDLFLDDRFKIISALTREQIDRVSKFYERIYDESHRINFIYRSINLPIPFEFCYAAGHVLSRRLLEEAHKMAEQNFSLRGATTAARMMETAKLFHVEIQKEPLARFLSEQLTRRIRSFVHRPDPELIRECVNIHKASEKFEVSLDYWQAQEEFFFFLKEWQENPEIIPEFIFSSANLLVQLMNRLQIGFEGLRKYVSAKSTT